MTPAMALLIAALAANSTAASPRPPVIASKPFAESYLLAELFAQLLESRGIPVERRLGLGATELAFSALREDAIDVYPEYTGTGLLAILREPVTGDAQVVFDRVSREFARRWGVRWLPPLGFENTYAIAVRRETAERERLTVLSDLRRVDGKLRAGFTADFIGRPDGLPALERVYGVDFPSVQPLLGPIKYQALAEGAVDIVDGYSTDGLLARYDLRALGDDRRVFPPYEAAGLVGPRLQREWPEALAVLTLLSGRLDVERMRALNRRVEVDAQPVAEVAADALRDLQLLPSVPGAPPATPARKRGLLPGIWARRGWLLGLVGRHLALVAASMALAVLVAVPAGLLAARWRRGEALVRAAGLLQTVPGIALLAFMLPVVGIGVVPAMLALFLYSLYPILRNTSTGVKEAAPDAVAAGRALGMSPWQVMRYVRLPLAAPVVMSGIRTAAVINVGTATLAAFIGAGGLGEPIVSGLALADTGLVLSGAIPAALLALVLDGALALCERLVRPRGLEPAVREKGTRRFARGSTPRK